LFHKATILNLISWIKHASFIELAVIFIVIPKALKHMMLIEKTIQRKPHLFLSHSSKNKDFVLQLGSYLNILEIDVWLDVWEMTIGDSLFDKLSEGLADSKFICLVISNDFHESKWASNELKQAFAREMREGKNLILPIIIENVKIPSFIEDKIYIDFTTNYYSAISKLAGMIHNLDNRAIDEAVRYYKPKAIKDCIEVLRYAGYEPYIMVDKAVFDEILKLGGISYKENRVRLNPAELLNSPTLSKRTREYLLKAINAWY
jgi:hypothetical protein